MSSTNYTIPCSSQFYSELTALAERHQASLGSIARSVLLTFTHETIAQTPDPGPPEADDRVAFALKSGAQAGKKWKRKPRIQLRLQRGYSHHYIRQALALALNLDKKNCSLLVRDFNTVSAESQLASLKKELEHYKTVVAILMFTPPSALCQDLSQAAYVLSLNKVSSLRVAKQRYRQLVKVYHPDSYTGDSERMLHLNAVIAYLQQIMTS